VQFARKPLPVSWCSKCAWPEPLNSADSSVVTPVFAARYVSRGRAAARAAALVSVLAMALVLPFRASATLGGDLTSVDADQKQLQCVKRSTLVSGSYTTYELETQLGTVIREYVSPAGTVFGVAWAGPNLPDMRQILGSYYDQFEQAASARRQLHLRGPLAVEEPGLVVYSGGHMRAYTGKAYLPKALPQGLQPEAIR
jgi:hypothetical protein